MRDDMIKVQDDYESDAPIQIAPDKKQSPGHKLFSQSIATDKGKN